MVACRKPPISETMSFWITEVGEGFAVFEGEPGSHLLNPMGGVHGGWALTLIDSVVGCTGHSLLPAGIGYATVETKANFSRPITKDTGRVRAEAHVVAQGRQIISSEAKVLGRDGKAVLGPASLHILLGTCCCPTYPTMAAPILRRLTHSGALQRWPRQSVS